MTRSSTCAAVCALLAASATPALSQTQADIDALSARVAQLEAQVAEGGNGLNFNLGANTTIDIYGFVRAEAFYDFDFAQGDLSRAGRVGDPAFATDGEFDTSVRVSRFGIRTSTETDIGQIGTQLEYDLFGSGGEDSGSPNLRLRHANITINDTFLIGQFWTNFMPLQHYPTTADFNGPVGITFARVPQLRYTYNAGNGLQVSASIEEPNGGGSDPVLTAAVAYSGANYSVRAAGLVSTFESGGEELDATGLTVSGDFQPWEGGNISATYVIGDGLGNLLIGGGVRAVGDQVNESEGFTVAVSQELNDQFTVGVTYGNESYDLATPIGESGNAFTDLQSLHASVFYSPVENLTLAAEYIYIESEGPDGFSAEADRIGVSATFTF